MEDSEFALEHVGCPEINIWGSFVDRNFEIMRVNITKKREKRGRKAIQLSPVNHRVRLDKKVLVILSHLSVRIAIQQ